MTVDEDQTVDVRLGQLADAATMQASPGATIRPALRPADTEGRRAAAALTAIADPTAVGPRITLHETLGEGAMGVVRRGTQKTLGRDVAVKSVRPPHADSASTHKLLQEAWITGRLEHPNIIPVYDLELVDGEPHVLLRRVEGLSWAELLSDRARVEREFGATDLLEWNLRILIQVCNALQFAHDRGIVHLDLKPENVMVGRLGQVYLVDWGIAMSLVDDDSGQLPVAADNRDVRGTPSYMAPEMVGGEPLSTRTDVYLVGAVLFEILAGHAPHQGETLMAVLHHVLYHDPRVPGDAPAELARLCSAALTRDVQHRVVDVDGIRRGLDEYLQHRGSQRLAHEAAVKLDALDAALAATSVPPRRELYGLFAAARFGFQEALSSWSRNPAALEGLARGTIALIRYELSEGDARAAVSLAAELEGSHPEIEAEIEAAVQAASRREENLAALASKGRAHSLDIGKRTRLFVTLVFGLASILLPLLGHVYQDTAVMQRQETLVVAATAFFVFGAALGYWARDTMSKTKVNLRYWAALLGVLAIQVVVCAVGWLNGAAVSEIGPQVALIWFVTTLVLAFTLDRRAAPTPIAYGLAYVGASYFTDLQFVLLAGATTAMLLNVTVIWWPETVRGPMPGQPEDDVLSPRGR